MVKHLWVANYFCVIIHVNMGFYSFSRKKFRTMTLKKKKKQKQKTFEAKGKTRKWAIALSFIPQLQQAGKWEFPQHLLDTLVFARYI